jgi:hypothetical protein
MMEGGRHSPIISRCRTGTGRRQRQAGLAAGERLDHDATVIARERIVRPRQSPAQSGGDCCAAFAFLFRLLLLLLYGRAVAVEKELRELFIHGKIWPAGFGKMTAEAQGGAFQFRGAGCEKIRLLPQEEEAAQNGEQGSETCPDDGKSSGSHRQIFGMGRKESATRFDTNRRNSAQITQGVWTGDRASSDRKPGSSCASTGAGMSKCSKEMRYKGKKKTQVESRTGNLDVERGYYYCKECELSIFPPG